MKLEKTIFNLLFSEIKNNDSLQIYKSLNLNNKNTLLNA